MYIAETRDFVHLTEFISPVDVLPYDWSFYMYDGSLTTPPCSRNVRWIVMRCPIRISAEVEIKLSLYTTNFKGHNWGVGGMPVCRKFQLGDKIKTVSKTH